jgi:alpha-tubulin suppressor-like RCC1 family protein
MARGPRDAALLPARLLAVLVLAVAACDTGTAPRHGKPTGLALIAGQGQIAAVGITLPQEVVVKVLDDAGNAVPGVRVDWSIHWHTEAAFGPGGQVDPDTSSSDKDGLTHTTVTLGTTVGIYVVTASLSDAQPPVVAFAEDTALAGPLARLAPDTVRLVVRNTADLSTTDSYGNPLSDSAAEWRSSDPGVAVVDSVGGVTAVAAGTAQITATLADATASTEVSVLPAANLLALGLGSDHSCGLLVDGTAYCWGSRATSSGGALGTLVPPSTCYGLPCNAVPALVTGGLTFQHIVAGGPQSCGTTADGATYCWGAGATVGVGVEAVIDAPTRVAGDPGFVRLVASGETCGLTAAGRAYCWGDNQIGEVGDGSFQARTAPTPVATDSSFVDISVGGNHACAVTASGAVLCWGYDGTGALGNGQTLTTTPFGDSLPVLVVGGRHFTSIAAGGTHTCALDAAGEAYCWGANDSGQLGDGTTAESNVPVAVAGGLAFVAISSGLGHSCALNAAGQAFCWGANDQGQLGDGTTTARDAPVAVAAGLGFAWISAAGQKQTCGVTAAGDAYCWGWNRLGQLGNGTSATHPVTLPVGVYPPGN